MKIFKHILIGASIFMFAVSAQATMILEVSSGGDTIQITDNELFKDFSSKNGKIISILEDFNGWDITTTAFANPAIGDMYTNELDLNSIAVSGGAGSIELRLTNTGYSGGDAPYVSGVAGTTEGTVSFQSYFDSTNTAFGTEYLLANSGTLTGLVFSSEQSGGVISTGTYSLTSTATISHTSASDVTSFDFHVKVPEPASLSLLGLGLIGLGFAGRRKNKSIA